MNNTIAKIYAGKDFNIEEYTKMVRSDENMLQAAPGNEIKQTMMIGDLEIPEDHQPIMIVELKEERWVYSMPES